MTSQQPAPRAPHTGRRAFRGGWQQAVQPYAALAHGQPLPTVPAADFAGGAVYLDVPFTCARFFAMDVRYQPGSMFVIGSPGFVAGATIGRLIGTIIGYARAASLSRRQWRGHRPARVVVTATSTWCQLSGRWICFGHRAALNYQIEGGQACAMTFVDTMPLRLYGPSAWCHAVLYACLRHGPGFQAVPFLYPIRQAAQQIAGVRQQRPPPAPADRTARHAVGAGLGWSSAAQGPAAIWGTDTDKDTTPGRRVRRSPGLRAPLFCLWHLAHDPQEARAR